MSETIKVGFIGAGGNARGHMQRVSGIAGTEITAICDIDGTRAEQAAQEFGAVAYTDFKEMLDKESFDAVFISVPPNAHGEVEVLAAQKGTHFFIEKPVAMDRETIARVLAEITKAGIITCVGYQLRYMPTALAARDFLKDKTVGMVQGRYWGGTPLTPWWRVMSISGGQMLEQATHAVDMIRFLAGDIKSVYARYALRGMGDLENLDVPDVYSLTVEFTNGAVGTISSTCLLNTGGGTGGTDIDIILRDCLLHWNAAGAQIIPEGAGQLDTSPYPETTIDAAFINAVRTGDRSLILSDYADGAKSALVSIAANESAQSGKPVNVDLS
jgi:predicted dehydrogenase